MVTADDKKIVLYDIPTKLPGVAHAWSFNTWRARLALNYLSVSYRTEWISYPDIEAEFKKLGMPPTATKADGSPLYTCPAIIDPTTPPSLIADSPNVVEYLDTHHGTSERLFPDGTKQAQLDFYHRLADGEFERLAIHLLLPSVATTLEDPRSVEYFLRTKSDWLARPLLDVCPAGSRERAETWKLFKEELTKVAAIYDRNEEGKGLFFTGTSLTFADLVLGAYFMWFSLTPCDRDGEGVSNLWDVVKTLDGGRWLRFMGNIETYTQIH
ncbi:hypothetical protein FRB99_008019 [Tulasnella sp. 403]|nr:hypothetical protein FRB99_008019 [Tulasnella sp. 403]